MHGKITLPSFQISGSATITEELRQKIAGRDDGTHCYSNSDGPADHAAVRDGLVSGQSHREADMTAAEAEMDSKL